MKKLIFSLAAASAIAAAAPAAAQYGAQQNGYGSQNGYGYQGNVNAGGAMGVENRIAQLDSRFQAGVDSGLISRAEAQNIRPQLRQLRQLERQYSVNGLSQQERQDLQQRIRYVRQQLRAADGGGGQYANWDNEDRSYGQQGYQNQGYQNQGYQNQGYGQNRGQYGQGGGYEEVNEVCRSRSSGLGGILGTILGAGDNCLSVGERVRGNLPAVPYQYQGQFRDGGGYYHRYVDGRVVQIDARTQTVVRIYDTQ